MKALRITIAASMLLVAVVGLTGCGGDKRVAAVKALAFSYPDENVQDPNLTVDQALDYRKVCASVKWKVDMTEQHQTFVEYDCEYKNVKGSSFIANTMLKAKVENQSLVRAVRAGDVYQWTYGADGKPGLSYVALQYHYANGTSKDIPQTYAGAATHLMQAAVENAATDYDSIYAQLTETPIPPMPTAATEAALRQAYAEAHPQKLTSAELLPLFSPKVIGMSVSQYETLVGHPVRATMKGDGTEDRAYTVKGCGITVNDAKDRIDSVTVALDGSCPVTDADMPAYLQGLHWDWSRLTVKDINELASKTASDQVLTCAAQEEVGEGACVQQGPRLTTTIKGNQAGGWIDAAFVSRVNDAQSRMAMNMALAVLARRNNLQEGQVTSAVYNKDQAFMKDVMGQLNVDNVSFLTLQQGSN